MIEHYLNKWHLTLINTVTTTHTSDIYKVQQSNSEVAILKLLNAQGRKDEAQGGDLLEWYDSKGAVSILEKDQGAHLLQFATGGELSELAKSGQDQSATETDPTLPH